MESTEQPNNTNNNTSPAGVPPTAPGMPPTYNVTDVPRIRTYADDVKDAMRVDNTSMAQIAMAEQRRRDQNAMVDDASSRNPRNILLVMTGIALMAASGVVIWYFLTQNPGTEPAPVVVSSQKIIIEYDNRVTLSALDETRAGLQNSVRQVLSQPLAERTLTAVVFAENDTPLDLNVWLSRIQSRVPESLTRALRPTFLFGVYAHDYNSSFLLLEASSFQEAFAGMLAWEPDLTIDIDRFIYSKPQPRPASTSTPPTAAPAGQFRYIDRVIANRDARVYLDPDGRELFFYTFVTNELIFIGRDQVTLEEVIGRIQKEGLAR
jgi:hypothetical protein